MIDLQSETDKPSIVVGDLNTPFSVTEKDKEKPQGLTVLWEVRDVYHPLWDSNECTDKDILSVLRGWGCSKGSGEGF